MKKETLKEIMIEVEEFIQLTPENISAKSLELPKIYSKISNHYFNELRILYKFDQDLKELRKKIHHELKIGGSENVAINSLKEYDRYIEGDVNYLELERKYKSVKWLTEKLEDQLQMIKRMSFNIGHHIEMIKIKNGFGY